MRILAVIALFSVSMLNAQQISASKLRALPSVSVVDTNAKPILYADSAILFPDTLFAVGTISRVTFVPAPCGVMCWWGTCKLDLPGSIERYPSHELYLAVLCFVGQSESYIGKSVEVVVSKFLKKDVGFGCAGVYNSIDSKGVPFYKVESDRTGVLNRSH